MAGAYRACSEHVPASYRTCDAHMHTAYIIVTWRLQTGRITGTVTATCETIRLFSRRYDTTRMHAPTISPRALNCTSMSLPNRLELSLRTCVRPVRAGVCVRGVRGRADRLGVAERLENRRRLDEPAAERAEPTRGPHAQRRMPRSRTIAFTAEGTASKAYASPQTKRNAVGPMGCGAGRGRGRRRILSSPAARMALGHAHGRRSAPLHGRRAGSGGEVLEHELVRLGLAGPSRR